MKIRLFQIGIAAIAISVAFSPTAHAQQKQKELERVETLPTGSNINVLGTFFSTTNITEHVFDAPMDRVWMAVKVAARDFDRNARRLVVAIDERSNRVQNGKIDQMAMATAGAFGPFVDEFVTEVTRVSDTQTKVTVVRKVMERERVGRRPEDGWGPQKSNGRIEKYLLTQIADNLKKLSMASTQSSTGNEPPDTRDYAVTAAGKYSREGKPSDYMELDADKSFFLTNDGKSSAGTYRVGGNTLTLILPTGQASRATFKGETITDTEGIVWVKQPGSGAAVSDKK